MQYANAYQAYQHNRVSVESPAKLIEMLYEGILRFSSQANDSQISKANQKFNSVQMMIDQAAAKKN
ncbi:flagellar export chaperone FliS [Helicobacter pylori]